MMPRKKAAKSKKSGTAKPPFTPNAIVAAWRKRITDRLKPWSLEEKCFTKLEPALRKQIKDLIEGGAVFKAEDMRNSLRVAGDAARICKILQPAPHPKKISLDTFQPVLRLCAKQHRVCRGGGAAGGWCDIG